MAESGTGSLALLDDNGGLTRLDVGAVPTAVAIDSATRRAFVAVRSTSQIVVVDLLDRRVVGAVDLPTGAAPVGVAVDPRPTGSTSPTPAPTPWR